MAIYPLAVVKLLPENKTQSKITPTQVILHTAVSSADSLYGTFGTASNVLESHFYVRNDGTVEQYMDTTVKADANYNANVRAVSIETEDNGHPEKFPWSPAQLDALTKLIAWLCRTHKIPVRKCPAWDQPGIGWHVMFGAPGKWTPVAKSCPGPLRIKQVPGLIASVAKAVNAPPPVIAPKPTTPVKTTEVPVALSDADVARIAAAVWDYSVKLSAGTQAAGGYGEDSYKASQFLVGGDAQGRQVQKLIKDGAKNG